MMKSCFLLNWLFFVFEYLLSLISEIHLSIFPLLTFLSHLNIVIGFHISAISFVVFHFSGYFGVVDAFKVLFDCLFTIIGIQRLLDVIRL